MGFEPSRRFRLALERATFRRLPYRISRSPIRSVTEERFLVNGYSVNQVWSPQMGRRCRGATENVGP